MNRPEPTAPAPAATSGAWHDRNAAQWAIGIDTAGPGRGRPAGGRHFRTAQPDIPLDAFLATKSHLTEAELHYLTDIDHHDHEALAALDRPGGQGLGVARYIRDPTTRRPPRSPSQSSTTGTAGGLAPN